MQHLLLDLAAHFGYLVVLVAVGVESMGVPVPGETALLVGAVLAARGHLLPWGVGLAGWAGAVAGDNTGYLLGRRWGRRLLQRRLVARLYTAERVAAADHLFERYGYAAVFLGRFVALLRIFAGPLAGLHRMTWPRFLAANALGGLVWVTAVVVLGLLIGDNLELAGSILSRSGYAGLALVLAAGLLAGARLRRRRRRAAGPESQ